MHISHNPGRLGVPIGDRTGTHLRRPGGLASGHTRAHATAWGDGKDPRGEDGMGGHGFVGAWGALAPYFMSYLYAQFIYRFPRTRVMYSVFSYCLLFFVFRFMVSRCL